MRAHFGLPSVESELLEGKPPIQVKFEIPYFTTSGIQVIWFDFSNFSCVFLNPNIFFPIWILIVLIYYKWETSRNKLKSILLAKIVLTFHLLNKLL